MKLIKTQEAQIMGTYKATNIDINKNNTDFRILGVNPYFIRWDNGNDQIVTKRQLTKLQSQFNYATDF